MFDVDNEISLYAVCDIDMPQDLSEKDKRAIHLYNDAVGDIKTGNEDIANIKLKKAVSIMPDFYRAKLILGLYFIKIDEHAKARVLLDDVIENSKEYGEAALKYIRAINVQADKKNRAKQDESKDKEKVKDKTSLSERIRNIGRTIFLLTGILLGIMICLPFLLPGKGPGVSADMTHEAVISSLKAGFSEMSSVVAGREDEIKVLEEEIKRLEAAVTNPEHTTTAEVIQSTPQTSVVTSDPADGELSDEFGQYLSIMRLYQEEKYLEAADKIKLFIGLDTVKDSMYIADIQKTHDTLMSAAARFCEDGGVWYFEQERYRDSLSLLERTSYYLPGYTRMYRVNYYIGRCLFFLEEYELAKEKFQLVISQAPNADWIMYSNMRLDEINRLSSDEN